MALRPGIRHTARTSYIHSSGCIPVHRPWASASPSRSALCCILRLLRWPRWALLAPPSPSFLEVLSQIWPLQAHSFKVCSRPAYRHILKNCSQGFKPPFPTDTWWIGFGAPPAQNALVVQPRSLSSSEIESFLPTELWQGRGRLSLPSQIPPFSLAFLRTEVRNSLMLTTWCSTFADFDGISIHQPTQMDWGASFIEHAGGPADHKAISWVRRKLCGCITLRLIRWQDTQVVTVQYFQQNGAGTLTSPMVPGSPYLTLQYASATPLLTSLGGNIATVNGVAVSASGSK
jgi:hypothetical protein